MSVGKPFKKGDDPRRNLDGRPKGTSNIPDLLRKMYAVRKEGDKTRLENIIEKVLELAEQGVPWAVQFVADRTEGKPHQSMTVHKEADEIIGPQPEDD